VNDSDGPTIVFDTICTKDRIPWLANPTCHTLLCQVWVESSAWLVGRYVIMPDHIHLFAAPNVRNIDFDSWVAYWKRKFSLAAQNPSLRWQRDHWDRRMRSNESYAEKWDYVRNNPVRHGLVGNSDDWPYQGELNILTW